MDAGEEAELLRRDEEASDDEDTRQGDANELGSLSLVAVTKKVTTYPTTAASFYACTPVVVGGTEAEGQPGTFNAGTGTVYALNLGGTVPPSGTYVLLTFVENRWVFRYA